MKKVLMLVVCAVMLTTGVAKANPTGQEYQNIWEMANLSARVYDGLWDYALDVIAPVMVPVLDFEGNTHMWNHVRSYGGSSGFDAKLFHNAQTGKYALVFRGTQPFSPLDWMNDLAQILNDYIDISVPQYERAIEVVNEVLNEVGSENLQLTGHSLGGGLAQFAGIYAGVPTVCFEAAGTTYGMFEDFYIYSDTINLHKPYITHVNVVNDPLSDFDGQMNNKAPFSNTLQHGGKTYWLDPISPWLTGGTLNPLRVANHFYHTFVHQLYHNNFY
ncbi:MAG: Mbeg1-like protein [Desulfobacter sp.]